MTGPPALANRSALPLVTIAIPTFNRAGSFLPRALRAACDQSYWNLDILVADNASNDFTEELVRTFGDPRVRYHRHPENIGSPANTNFCIASSQGEYTLLLNDDDLIDSAFISTCMEAVSRGERPGLVRTGMRVIDAAGATIRTHPNQVQGLDFTEFIIAWTQGLTTPYLCNTLFKTAPLQQVGMHSRHYMWDDVITELKIAAAFGRVDIPDVLASACEHHGEIAHTAELSAWCEDSLELLETACQLSARDPTTVRSYLVRFLAKLNYQRCVHMDGVLRERLRAAWIVFRTFGVAPESLAWFKQVVAR